MLIYILKFHINMARMVATIGYSCEACCCSAYSEDLHWYIVYQCLDPLCRKVASNLGVDPLTVSHVAK